MRTLSPRQLELARLVAAGYSNTEIAQKLGISRQTVKNHVRAVFAKLNAHNRVQVALRIFEALSPSRRNSFDTSHDSRAGHIDSGRESSPLGS